MSDLSEKIAIVTGGSSGMGEGVVRRFLELGATVVVFDLNAPKLAVASYVHMDITDENAWKSSVQQVVEQFGRLDILVNCAGILIRQNIEETELATWNKMMTINVTGTMLGCREAVTAMKKNTGGASGSIINISSVFGKIGAGYGASYSASKGAVLMLTKSVANHCARHYQKIRCNSVHPGAMMTPMTDRAFAEIGDPELIEQFKMATAGQSPMNRFGGADEIAGAVAFLASEADSAFVTGASIDVDGGWLAAGGSA